ncbi:Zinc finger CCCH domain-containing protein 4 [Apostasia shenzhenica]|uniref:Zinc finger CCCH domain-containing protein 4 n=1 Tax=Apostasia shenzhenica TaxID=1088818 RepID=A0A2I0AQ55_9ASPA|nr:Zinc finger CCCH domain-containing protein 4 [Apostasia shenzhenica]
MGSVTDVSSSSSSSHSHWPLLPVMALRQKIVEKVRENRVTLIVGETGCGKSSQVPLFLLEENMQPILCTQPRRFAVVAIARMVAEARKCDVGEEVGYHIGHSKVSDMTSTRSKIVFKTAGVLLEQMRDKGSAALKYKVIILDEVHERSVESDLVLACVKQFMMKTKDFRVVLMSATADIARYRDYFKDLGRGERVEVIAIPSGTQHGIFQRKVLYLDQVTKLLGMNLEGLSDRYCSGSSPDFADADLKPELHDLILKLIMHIHKSESDIAKSVLVFLPTYYALEQQWQLLWPHRSLFKVHILHRSIDTDQAFQALQTCKSHRKVILATNIAESSVTIPGLAFVIDSCRSLQVFWDSNRKIDSTELVWVSKSQAEQRKGRTGRTCDGLVYRLVTGSFYSLLKDHEYPAILRLSLRKEVLMICCAESKVINDPKGLLQKVLDPPDLETIEDAISLLIYLHALEKVHSHRSHCEPTFYGRLLDSLPLSFDASVLALKFGEVGFLREGILISILMDIQPLPILQPFGHPLLCAEYLDNYFMSNSSDILHFGKKEAIFIANLCAFQFWQRVFKDKLRLERLKQIVKLQETTSKSLITKLEEEWCSFHNLSQGSLLNVSDSYYDIISSLHQFRPEFFTSNELPTYYEPYEFKHICHLQSEAFEVDDNLINNNQIAESNANGDKLGSSSVTRKCVATPFVALGDFQSPSVAEKFKNLIKEIRLLYVGFKGETRSPIVLNSTEPTICKYFLNGGCNRGDHCFFLHSLLGKRPLCKFFLTIQGCRNGDSCFFLHDCGPQNLPSTVSSACFQVEVASAASFLQLLPSTGDGCVLVLNDKNLYFTSCFSQLYNPSKVIVTSRHPESSEIHNLPSAVRIIWNVQPYQAAIDTKGVNSIRWSDVKVVLWFTDFEADNTEIYHDLEKAFEALAIRVLAESLSNLRPIIIMNNIRFSLCQVEKLARNSFFFLTESFRFDESSFGRYSDSCSTVQPMQVSAPFCYVFEMVPPTDIQFGDYASVLRKSLYGNQ